MQRNTVLLSLIMAVVLVISLDVNVSAAPEWPRSMNLGGFVIRDIKGKIAGDGSGQGSGKLVLPSGEVGVSLARSASGNVKAGSSQRFSVGQVGVEGSYEVDNGGLKGSGTINTGGAPITNASFRLDSRGNLSGNGRVHLDGVSVPVSFNISSSRLSASGSVPRQAVSETPLAYYIFKGELQLGSSRDSLTVNAKGNIERKGKVGNAQNSFGPVSNNVSMDSGRTSFNVAGVNVTFRFW